MALTPRPWEREPVPDLQLQARAHGVVEWQCLNCHRFNRDQHLNIRRPRSRCHNRLCRHIIEFAIGAETWSPNTTPCALRARLLPTSSGNPPRNILGEPPKSAAPVLGQFAGPLEWWCPTCRARNYGKIDLHSGHSSCAGCGLSLYFYLIMREPLPQRAATPPDWAPPAPERTPNVVSPSN